MSPPLILVVEDERLMRRVLLLALSSQGYAVSEAETGAQALKQTHERVPDAALLDLGLPDMDGAEVTAAIRREHRFPIIVVSARGEEQHQIRALDAGATDYVTKPFRQGELMARVRAALRYAAPGVDRSELEVGALRIDALQRRVFVRDVEVSLSPIEFKLLYALAREGGRVVTHRQLLREVWGPERVEEINYVRVYMKHLRNKIEVDPCQPRRILTTPGVGYRLASR